MALSVGGLRPQSSEAGFTLIELLVVIIIAGVLAAVAIPVYLNQRTKAVDASMRSDLRTAALAIETSMVDNPQLNSNVLPAAVTASPGNSVTMAYYWDGSGRGLYCVRVINPRSSKGAGPMLYNSITGGIMPFTGTYPPSLVCADNWGGTGSSAGQWSVVPVTG